MKIGSRTDVIIKEIFLPKKIGENTFAFLPKKLAKIHLRFCRKKLAKIHLRFCRKNWRKYICVFAEKIGENTFAFLLTLVLFLPIFENCSFLRKNGNFFAANWQKSQKIVIIASTPDSKYL
jgi:hypothetical protein